MSMTRLNVWARWGYSEITSPRFSRFYDAPELSKKRSAGLPFEGLTSQERYKLALQCSRVRRPFAQYFVGVKFFREIPLAIIDVGSLLVPAIVWSESGGAVVRFKEYMQTKTDSPDDARNVVPNAAGYIRPCDPVTVGWANGHRFIVDGYHRAAEFWKQRPIYTALTAYVPSEFDI
jgi:hypothetical protein